MSQIATQPIKVLPLEYSRLRPARPHQPRKSASIYARFIFTHTLLLLVALTMFVPFAWMVLISLKSIDQVESANPLPVERGSDERSHQRREPGGAPRPTSCSGIGALLIIVAECCRRF